MNDKVSIIIPTRSRAHLLQFAIESCLCQIYDNLEIVICDNNSTDATPEVSAKFIHDKRVRYIRTPESLSMPDNWEHALHNSTGEYCTILTDDSVLFPNSIQTIMERLHATKQQVAVWKHSAYYYPDWFESSRRNVLYVPKSGDRHAIIDSNKALDDLFNMRGEAWTRVPKSLNSICHRDVIASVVNRQGRFFLPSCPDYSSAAAVLFNVASYLLIDEPLYIDSVTKESIGATTGYNMGPATQNFLAEFKDGVDSLLSLGIPVSPAGVAKSLENVALHYPERHYSVDARELVYQIADRLAKVQVNGADVRDYWRLLGDYAKASPPLANALRKARILSGAKWQLVRIARMTKAMSFLESMRGFTVYRGAKAGFSNIQEAAKFIEAKQPQP